MDFVLANCSVFDGYFEQLEPERDLLIRNGAFGTSLPRLATTDLLVVNGNPLEDIGLLEDRDNLRLIVRGGRVVKNTLHD